MIKWALLGAWIGLAIVIVALMTTAPALSRQERWVVECAKTRPLVSCWMDAPNVPGLAQ